MRNANQTTMATIPCKVSLGMFSTERGVSIELPEGRKVAALVDRRHVIVDREPPPDGEVDGRLIVSVVAFENGSVIVDLPQPGIAEGPRLRVPRGMIKVIDQ
jgi:hypothetical protein